MLVPQPWFMIPSHADVLGPDGQPTPVAQVGYPVDLFTLAVRCVYTEDEVQARALMIVVRTFGRVSALEP